MIRYALRCEKDHAFESWFRDSRSFEEQAERGLVSCPVCGSGTVKKALMAPRLGRTAPAASASQSADAPPSGGLDAPNAAPPPPVLVAERERALRARLKELREHLTERSDYVGPRFPEEARRIHYGEVEQRAIHGEASLEEAKALHEEGVAFQPLPTLPDERN